MWNVNSLMLPTINTLTGSDSGSSSGSDSDADDAQS